MSVAISQRPLTVEEPFAPLAVVHCAVSIFHLTMSVSLAIMTTSHINASLEGMCNVPFRASVHKISFHSRPVFLCQ